MLKVSFGYVEERKATIIAFGLSHQNLDKLIDEKMPISITSETMKLSSDIGFLLIGANTRDDIGEEIAKLHERMTGNKDEDADIDILHVSNQFYLVTFHREDAQLCVIGFDDASRASLKDDKWFKFSIRGIDDSLKQAVEVIIFSAESEDKMETMIKSLTEGTVQVYSSTDGDQV